jgi:hypothetical protein
MNLTPGTYFLRIEIDTMVKIEKIILMRPAGYNALKK